MENRHQLLIIGGGPAGLTAGLYAARSRLDTVLLEGVGVGGQILSTELIENFPGFPDGISGFDLAELLEKQATRYGLKIVTASVEGLELEGRDRVVHTVKGDFVAPAVIIAGGATHSKLGVPGEEELLGKGVSYCATCDGAFFRDQVVSVVGGGNSAVGEALTLTRFARKVYVVHRRDELRAAMIMQERAFASPKIEIVWDSVVEAIDGNSRVEQLRLRNVVTGEKAGLPVDGVFVAVGIRPNTGYLEGLLKLAPGGFIPVNLLMETEIPGVFAAGDIREASSRQAVAAAGDGAVAALTAEKYLGE